MEIVYQPKVIYQQYVIIKKNCKGMGVLVSERGVRGEWAVGVEFEVDKEVEIVVGM